ncbi:hypothetical protein ASE66_24235 [Bosea sp. Root483D1]|uniref:hypothetical protein n=1 Tax=Bosea sp. Root483D1 TaxID=1736544 RepID=UPI000709F006|nr:hypothetical protein [Bosea sp. Root483D1]KRE11637.1 hypothetical protein ASE66_24235 [Bosea sp. Root483D1]
MRTQPKQSGLSDRAAARPASIRRELYRELCQDEDGNRYTVIVYRPVPDLNVTRYELEDGTPVRFVDDCLFEMESTGRTLTRCEL